ncbi:MAG: efflux RND transporter permease subunit [Lysobacterales bacterium]|nr:efflux RND transporter permease subunit [Xanthomonadales bacterium]
MNLSVTALRYQSAVYLIAVLVMAYGVYSYFNLPAREDPEILVREAVVVTTYPGLEASRIEMLVTKPLEEAIVRLPEIKEIRSTSMDGVSIIHPVLDDNYTDLSQIFDQLREKVQDAARNLPEGTNPPVLNDEFGDVAIITLALWGDDFEQRQLYDYAQHLRDQMLSIPGTKKIEIVGAQPEQIFIEFQDAVASQFGISPGEFVAAIQNQNIILPGGQIDTGNTAFIISPTGDYRSLGDIESTLLNIPGSETLVRLGDVAQVRHGYVDPPRNKAYFNGREAVVLTVAMRSDQSVLNYSRRASASIDALRTTLPAGLHFDVITYQADQVENAVYGVSVNMMQTLFIVLIVVVIFLGIRTGLVVGSIIPAVILATLGVMGIFGMQLERMSLATLIISLGLLVDNGIVIAEDFKRRLSEHGDRDRALQQTSAELAFPLLASSFTTIAVFLPLMIAQTASAEYTRSISQVILISLSLSWVFAMTVTTTLCYHFVRVPAPSTGGSLDRPSASARVYAGAERVYGKVLKGLLRFRWSYLGFMVVALLLSGALMGTINQKFLPESDRAQILVYVDLPAGVTQRTTQARLEQMMKIIDDKDRYPDVISYAGYVGFGGPRFVLSLAPVDPAPNKAFIVINLIDIDATIANVPRLRDDFRAAVPDANTRVSRMFLGQSDPNVIELQLKGPDADYLFAQSAELEQMLLDIPGTIDIWSDWYNRIDRLEVRVDQHAARIAGVTSADIARVLGQFASGSPVSQYRDGDEVIPIVIRSTGSERNSIDRLRTASLYSSTAAEAIPLSQVASVDRVPGYSFIQREDLTRTVTVQGRNPGLTPQDMVPILAPKIAEFNKTLAPGHYVEFDGLLNEINATNAALAATMPLIFSLFLVTLVVQFNGFKRPTLLLMTLPFVIIGAAVGLYVMQATFGFMVILGLFALVGILVNNSIVLVDRIDIETREAGRDPFEAVVSACQRRLWPILMSTFTTVIGLLPLIIANDILFFGMASALAFGLALGTLLVSLGLTPVLYCLFFNISPEPTVRMQASVAPA